MEDPEARAYFAYCDAQGTLNALFDAEESAPGDIEAARQAWRDTRREWLRITGQGEEQ